MTDGLEADGVRRGREGQAGGNGEDWVVPTAICGTGCSSQCINENDTSLPPHNTLVKDDTPSVKRCQEAVKERGLSKNLRHFSETSARPFDESEAEKRRRIHVFPLPRGKGRRWERTQRRSYLATFSRCWGFRSYMRIVKCSPQSSGCELYCEGNSWPLNFSLQVQIYVTESRCNQMFALTELLFRLSVTWEDLMWTRQVVLVSQRLLVQQRSAEWPSGMRRSVRRLCGS